MATIWQPLASDKMLKLTKRDGDGSISGNHYIVTRWTVAGRTLPAGFAVCRAVDQPDAPAAGVLTDEVREMMEWALSWAKNDSRAIRLHSTAMEHEAIMASIDKALAWLAEQEANDASK